MKLDVPFYKQTTPLNCGPVALKMVLAYFGKDFPTELIEEKVGIKEGKGVTTTRLAIASADFGFKTKFFSKSLLFNKENLKLDFVKKYVDEADVKESKKLVEEATNKGVKLQEKTLSLEEILSYVTEESIPIILIDWNIIVNREGYLGHFAPIVGYDKENIYIHQHSFDNPTPFFSIKKDLFDKARKAQGTDEDILIIYKNKSFGKTKDL